MASRRLRLERLAALLFAMSLVHVPPLLGDEGIEQSFGLGPVKATVRLAPAKPLIGDPVTLTLTVVADKDVEILMPEFGEALDRYTILDFVPRQFVDGDGRTVAMQRYRLQPSSSGTQAIPPILIEFVDRREGRRAAPEGQDAYELLTERIEFVVESVLPRDAGAELKPPLGKLAPLASSGYRVWPWLAGLVVLLFALSPWIYRILAAWRRRARRRSAYEIARARLDRLLAAPRPSGEQVDIFYVELSGIIRRYLEDRFELRAPELTTEEFLASVGRSSDLAANHQTLLREFLRQADLVKFARHRPASEDVEMSILAAKQFLEETRENAPLLEVEDEPVQSADVVITGGGIGRG